MQQQSGRTARISELVNGLLQRARTADEAALKRAGEGEWTASQVLAHVSEMLPFWAARAREVGERSQDGGPFGRSTPNAEEDPARLDAVERYGTLAGEDLTRMLENRLQAALTDIQAIRDYDRTARHANGLVRTVAGIVDQLIIAHLEDHTRQLDALLKR